MHGCFLVSHLAVLLKVAVGRDCGESHPAPTEARPLRAPGYPLMSSLSGSNILIVGEAPGTLELRERLIESGANVHVVSVAGAKLLLQQKQIDTAFIAASLEHDTQELSEELSSLGISQIFITPERPAPLDAAIARGVNLNRLRRKLRTPALT